MYMCKYIRPFMYLCIHLSYMSVGYNSPWIFYSVPLSLSLFLYLYMYMCKYMCMYMCKCIRPFMYLCIHLSYMSVGYNSPWIFYSVPLSLSLFLYLYYAVFITMILQNSLKSGIVTPPVLLLCSGLFWLFEAFCVSIQTLRLIFFYLCEESHWNFDGDLIDQIDCFW
jgi:hypothetical protein